MPSGPLSQLPMDQIPPTPAKVIFQGGLLTISAQNSTLGEILRDVRKLTGASIEIPAGAGANERVVTSIGPGAPREVLAVLLNGSSFNYVMTGSNTDPSAVSSVVLMSKPPAPGGLQPAPTVAENVYQSSPGPSHPVPFMRQNGMVPPLPVQQVNAQPDAESDDTKDEEAENADEPEDQAQQVEQGDAATQEQQTQGPSQPNAGPKTPEQILEMLRRQQQQPPGAVPPQPLPPQVPPQQQPPEQ